MELWLILNMLLGNEYYCQNIMKVEEVIKYLTGFTQCACKYH